MRLRTTWGTLLVLSVLSLAHGQGLTSDPNAVAKAGGTFASFDKAYGKSEVWLTAMQVSPRSACTKQASSLCSSSLNAAQVQALALATAPQSFDARKAVSVGPVKNQGNCGTCVAFVVLATAQTAAAMALRTSFPASLSEHDFYFCRTAEEEFVRNCQQGMDMKDGVAAFVRLQKKKTLPVLDTCAPYEPGSGSCARKCETTIPQLLDGTFKGVPLDSIPDMQKQIRDHGSIMCRFQLYSDTRQFWDNNPDGVYKKPGPGAIFDQAHAVQVVGYDNRRKAWLIKNTWGDTFARKGFAWVAFDAPGMCAPQETYGFVFTPNKRPPPVAVKLERGEVPGRRNCYRYTAIPADYPERIASRFGLNLQQLVLDNLAVIKDPSTVPAGTVLKLCDVSSTAVSGVVQGSLARQEQPAAPSGSCPRCVPRRFLSVKVCRPMTLIIKSRNPTTGKAFDTSWDFLKNEDLNTYFNLQTDNVNIEVDPGATDWRAPGQDWQRMNMAPEPADCSKPCSCCKVTQRYQADFDCGGGAAGAAPGARPNSPQTCPPCKPRSFLTVKVCKPQKLTIKGKDPSNGMSAFEGTWTYAVNDTDLNKRLQLTLSGKDFEIDPGSTDWRSDIGSEWQRVNMIPLNGECEGTCNCCGVRKSWYAEFDCSEAGVSPAPAPNSQPAPAGQPTPAGQPNVACPTCVPHNRLVVKVCKANKLSIRSTNPRTGKPVVNTWDFTKPANLNTDIQLAIDDVPIEIDPAATDFRVEDTDWKRMVSEPVKGKCEGVCSCCNVLLNHYATFDC